MPRMSYNVAPRYTPGSPAMVAQHIAERVIEQEQDGYRHALEGIYGVDAQRVAQTQGLAGIVWTTTERRNALIKSDLITGVVTSQRIKRDGTLVPEIVQIDPPPGYERGMVTGQDGWRRPALVPKR